MSELNDVHFIGIGGIGMSGLAKLLKERGVKVSGSDTKESPLTDSLRQMGITVHRGHSKEHISEGQTVIYSSDISEDNVEIIGAKEISLPLLHRSELLQKMTESKRMLAVAGTHGKTTTSSLLAFTLEKAGLSPSFLVGGIVRDLGTNASYGNGDYFVIEADESDGSFLNYSPDAAIVTNIDFDHMNYFQTKERLLGAFQSFLSKVQGEIIFCGDDSQLRSLAIKGISYGFSEECRARILSCRASGWGMNFSLSFRGKLYEEIELSLIGRHNVLNAAAVFTLALLLGADEEKIRTAFRSFQGAKRRQERRGEVRSVLVLDDYAHHPTEIRETIHAVAEALSPRRIVAIYQPHRPSRLIHILGQFEGVFDAADEVIITDLYLANESPVEGVTAERLFEEVKLTHPHVRFTPQKRLLEDLARLVRPHDVVLMMGAGDISKLSGDFVSRLEKDPPRPLRVALLQGGRSSEHEISLLSAKHVESSLDPELYQVESFTISKEGEWLSPETFKRLEAVDIFFPVLHGPFGEDGTIQGFLEILGKPYAGPGFRGAAIAMDKALTKRMAVAAEIPTKPFLELHQDEWRFKKSALLKKVQENLSFPLFVKPSHLGSSIGVAKVELLEELAPAITSAFRVDDSLILEEAVPAPREIEFCLLGGEDPLVFPPGEVLTGGEVYDYTAKYSSSSMPTTVDPKLSTKKIEEGMALAKRLFQLAGCDGMARIDFFLDGEGNYWLNEINPIPGFTAISLYPKILERHGISSTELMNRLIQWGLRRERRCRK